MSGIHQDGPRYVLSREPRQVVARDAYVRDRRGAFSGHGEGLRPSSRDRARDVSVDDRFRRTSSRDRSGDVSRTLDQLRRTSSRDRTGDVSRTLDQFHRTSSRDRSGDVSRTLDQIRRTSSRDRTGDVSRTLDQFHRTISRDRTGDVSTNDHRTITPGPAGDRFMNDPIGGPPRRPLNADIVAHPAEVSRDAAHKGRDQDRFYDSDQPVYVSRPQLVRDDGGPMSQPKTLTRYGVSTDNRVYLIDRMSYPGAGSKNGGGIPRTRPTVFTKR